MISKSPPNKKLKSSLFHQKKPSEEGKSSSIDNVQLPESTTNRPKDNFQNARRDTETANRPLQDEYPHSQGKQRQNQ